MILFVLLILFIIDNAICIHSLRKSKKEKLEQEYRAIKDPEYAEFLHKKQMEERKQNQKVFVFIAIAIAIVIAFVFIVSLLCLYKTNIG